MTETVIITSRLFVKFRILEQNSSCLLYCAITIVYLWVAVWHKAVCVTCAFEFHCDVQCVGSGRQQRRNKDKCNSLQLKDFNCAVTYIHALSVLDTNFTSKRCLNVVMKLIPMDSQILLQDVDFTTIKLHKDCLLQYFHTQKI